MAVHPMLSLAKLKRETSLMVCTRIAQSFDRLNYIAYYVSICQEAMKEQCCPGRSLSWRVVPSESNGYLPEFVSCHSGMPQGSRLGPLFLIADAQPLFSAEVRIPSDHVYRIVEHEMERVEEIKDLVVFLDKKLTFLTHSETIIS
jgi:hypothetical protein